jgi:hypothetical protein
MMLVGLWRSYREIILVFGAVTEITYVHDETPTGNNTAGSGI